jgi:adsorption protein B
LSEWLQLVDHGIALILLPLTVFILVFGLDDLFVNAVFVLSRFEAWRSAPPPEMRARAPDPQRPIAILVPCWSEAGVIVTMVEHNQAVIRYPNHHMFIGVYPNDGANVRAVRELEARFPRVHMLIGPKNGPSYKGDNLNSMYQALPKWEQKHGLRFEGILTHDAEDVIHPDALATVDRYLNDYDMVQIPVLPKPTKPWEWTHGIYCDEFAEFQCRDMLVRGFMGSFMPSNGVGTGYRRKILDKLLTTKGECLFSEGCLTEDYEIGLRLHRLGAKQIFVPLRRGGRDFVTTRELFPQTIQKALKQRTRWVTGIGLQTWERYGWSGTAAEVYWFWRDRRGLFGNPIGFFCNLVTLAGAITWMLGLCLGQPLRFVELLRQGSIFQVTLGVAVLQLAVRGTAVSWVYGRRFALLLPIRTVHANWINAVCCFRAFHKYWQSKRSGKPVPWSKTEHVYPTRGELRTQQRLLGEILVAAGCLSPELLREALQNVPKGQRIGEYLVQTGRITEDDLYQALSVQQSLPAGRLEPKQVSRNLARSLPRRVMERWKVLPYRVVEGNLFLASPEVPSDEMNSALRPFTRMTLRFQLVTPRNFEELKSSLL